MKIHLCSAAVLAIASSASYGQSQPVQWRVEDGGNGHWYQWVGTGGCWTARQLEAAGDGGHLAAVIDLAELRFIQERSSTFFYLGGYRISPVPEGDPTNGWRWITGEPYNMSLYCPGWYPDNERWATGGPSANCVGESNECDNYWFINEWSADCNNDGIVDYGQCRDGSLPDYNGNNIPDCCEAGTPCEVGSYPVQWRVENGGNGHWYAKVAVSPLPTTIAAMQGFAASRGADLASIASSEENERILSLLGSIGAGESYSAWIGLYRPTPGDPWRWTDGSAITWAGWGGASCTSGPYPNDMPFPGELGTVIYRQNCGLVWDDSPTDWIQNPPPWWGGVAGMTLVLEWSADCNGDGIVDYGQILAGQLSDANGDGVPDTCTTQPCDGAFLDDDFTAPSLDTSRWTTKLPYSCSSLQLGNGEALLQGRAQILTVSDFPATGGGFRLEFGFRYVSGSELFAVSLLTSGDTSGTCCAQVNNGLSLYWHSFNSPSTIVLLDPGQFTSTNFVRTGSLTVQAGDVFLVEIEVTDSRVEAVYRKASDSTQVMTLGWDWSGTPLGNKIAFFNREFCSTRTALLYARVYRLLDPTGDIDGDGILNCSDNCPSSANPAQEDCNGNGVGDACDLFADCDGDGVSDDCEILSGDATDFDSNSVPDSCECLADLSGNGVVNGVDLAAVLSSWGTNGQSELNADINRDGIVNGQDLAFVLGAWGPCP